MLQLCVSFVFCHIIICLPYYLYKVTQNVCVLYVK
uniref:Uncharacterized protein n=1 Tax=Rhizophora mucronata TaxID=61149 RepID=A0A2P2Q4Q2_RHIMU